MKSLMEIIGEIVEECYSNYPTAIIKRATVRSIRTGVQRKGKHTYSYEYGKVVVLVPKSWIGKSVLVFVIPVERLSKLIGSEESERQS